MAAAGAAAALVRQSPPSMAGGKSSGGLGELPNPLSSPAPFGVTAVSGGAHLTPTAAAYVLYPTNATDFVVKDAHGAVRYTVVENGLSLHSTTLLYDGASGEHLLTLGDKWWTAWTVGMVARAAAPDVPVVELRAGTGPGEKNTMVVRWTAAASAEGGGSSGGGGGGGALPTEHPFAYAAGVDPAAGLAVVDAARGAELACIEFGQTVASPAVLRLAARLDVPLFVALTVILKRWAAHGTVQPLVPKKSGTGYTPLVVKSLVSLTMHLLE